jgi:hypothetical protein
MHRIHHVFPEDDDNSDKPITKKKLLEDKGCMSIQKTLLGFDFKGEDKTLWLKKQAKSDPGNIAWLAMHERKRSSRDIIQRI